MDCPEIPSVLLAHLERMFPDKALRSDAGGLFVFGKAAGEQGVLDYLRTQHQKQQEASTDVQSPEDRGSQATRSRSRRADGISVRI